MVFSSFSFQGFVTQVLEDDNFMVDFLHPTSLPSQYCQPRPKDEVAVKKIYIFVGPLLPPVPTSGGRLFTLPQAVQVDETCKKFKDK